MHTRVGSSHSPETSQQTAIRIGDDDEEETMHEDQSAIECDINLDIQWKVVCTQAICITIIHYFLAKAYSKASCQESHWKTWIFLAPPFVINAILFTSFPVILFTQHLKQSYGTQIDEAKVIHGLILVIFVGWTLLTPLGFYFGYYEFECVKELE